MLRREGLYRGLYFKYVFFFLTLLIVSCVLIGSVFSVIYMRNFNEHNARQTQERAEMATADLDAQLDSLRVLAIRLSTQSVCKPSVFLRDKYNEILLLNAISQYRVYSSLCPDFVLVYANEPRKPMLFRSDGTKTEMDVFLDSVGITNMEARDFLLERQTNLSLRVFGDLALIACPVHANTYSEVDEYTTLCFVLPMSALSERVSLSSGLTVSDCSVFYNNTPLLTRQNTAHVVHAGSSDNFSITVNIVRTKLFYPSGNMDILMITAATTIVIICILYFAYRCWQPIRKLAKKYAISSHVSGTNELHILDETLDKMRSSFEHLTNFSRSQNDLLRNYLLVILLIGAAKPHMREDLSQLDIRFEWSNFFVLTLTPRTETVSNAVVMRVCNALSIAPPEGTRIWTVEVSPDKHIYAILCNMDKSWGQEMLLTRLQEAARNDLDDIRVGIGQVVKGIEAIPASYLTALSQMCLEERSLPLTGQTSDMDYFRPLTEMLLSLEAGDLPRALANESDFLGLLANDGLSELTRRYLVFSALRMLQQTCARLSYSFSREQMSLLLTANSPSTLDGTLSTICPDVCRFVAERLQQTQPNPTRLVMDYLYSHFREYAISINGVAAATGVSVTRVNEIVKRETGSSYKNYIIQLRMDEARVLLRTTSVTVNEISASLGYASVSHFIKAFRTIVGQTPASYR